MAKLVIFSAFFADTECHKYELGSEPFGFDVCSHSSKDIGSIISDHHNRNGFSVNLIREGRNLTLNENQVLDYFIQYFEQHYEKLMKEETLSIPHCDHSSLRAPVSKILKTIRDWCNITNKKGSLKGFVIHGYYLNKHLEFLNYSRDIFQNSEGDSGEVTIVYNPAKRVVFIVRVIKDKNFQHEMQLSTMDMMKFALLYNDVLVKSRVTLINLLVTNEKPNDFSFKCKNCISQVIPVESLTSSKSLEKWWENKEEDFVDVNSYYKDVNTDFSIKFPAKLFGFLASFQFQIREGFYGDGFPSLPVNPVQQMSQTILMTPAQTRIVYSPKKHLMIKGCYGSGKTIVACNRAQVISRLLGKEDSLYYIICDSKSMLKVDLQLNPEINVFHNVNQKPESAIVEEIVKSDLKKGKLNLIFDEFDGENLTITEAKRLNYHFTINKRLKDSNVIFICQPLEITREVNNIKKEGNMFQILETMNPPEELTINLRTTLEINNIVTATVNVLELHKPVHHSSATVTTSELHKPVHHSFQNKVETSVNVGETVSTRMQDECSELISRKRRRKSKEKNTKEDTLDCKKIKPDEVFDGSPDIEEGSVQNKITSLFHHRQSKKPGHHINSELPNLFEIEYPKESLELKIQLIAALCKITGRGSATKENNQLDISDIEDLTDIPDIRRHVILHFDINNNIPKTFHIVFELMGLSEKVTNKYEEFKRDKSKKIFICHYRMFRGLEYPRVIVILDPSLYHLLHFLPECLSRCTTFLHIIILKMLTAAECQTPKESFQNIVKRWKQPLNGQPLVKQWEIRLFDNERDHANIFSPSVSEILEQMTVRIKPDVYTELKRQIEKILAAATEKYDQTFDWKQRESEEVR